MQKFRLFYLLEKLNSSEFRHLERFVASPFFNQTPKLIHLFRFLAHFQSSFSSPELTKEAIHAAVWPDTDYNLKKITNLMHRASKLVEDFMMQMELRNDPKLNARTRANAFHTRKMTADYINALNNLEKLVSRKATNGIAGLSEALILYDEQFGMVSTKTDNTFSYMDKPAKWVKELGKLTDLKFIVEGFSHSKVRDSALQKARLDDLLSRILPIELESSLVQIYYKLIQCYEQPSIDALQICFDYFKAHYTIFSEREQRTIFISMANISIKIGNTGDLNAKVLCCNIYQFAFKNDIALDQNSLNEMTFTNAALISSSVGEFKYTEQFIKTYAPYLATHVRENAVNLVTAYLYFNKKDYQQSIIHLQSVQFTNEIYKLRAKVLSIRAAYAAFKIDENGFDNLVYQVNSFYKFISRSIKFEHDQKEFYLKYSRILLRIARVKLNKRDIAQHKLVLHSKIKASPTFFMKSTLLNEINEL